MNSIISKIEARNISNKKAGIFKITGYKKINDKNLKTIYLPFQKTIY
jgi:hypothetical protein